MCSFRAGPVVESPGWDYGSVGSALHISSDYVTAAGLVCVHLAVILTAADLRIFVLAELPNRCPRCCASLRRKDDRRTASPEAVILNGITGAEQYGHRKDPG